MLKKSVLLFFTVLTVILIMTVGTVNVFAEGYLRLECEEFDDCNPDANPFNSGQFIRPETSKGTNVGDIGNVGGSFEGGWLLFENVDFGNNGAKKVTLQYCNNSNRCTADARVELRIGSTEGEVIAEFAIPPTGENWNTYSTVTADLKKIVTGKQDLYLMMLGETTADRLYIANFDYLEFTEAAPGEAPTPTESKTTPTPTQEPTQTPEQTQAATPAPSPSQSANQSPSPTPEPKNEPKGPSVIVYIVIVIVLAAAGVVAYVVIKNKKQ